MRMWMVDPAVMCHRHLLGEHVEIHMCVGTLLRGRSVEGFLRLGLLQLGSLRRRHDELVREMERRGFRHRSPLPPFPPRRSGRVDAAANLAELARRCPDCRRLQLRSQKLKVIAGS